jgi:hypothetical protein
MLKKIQEKNKNLKKEEMEIKKEKKINLSEDLENTQQERRLINYQKYLKLWDKHENKMNKHFYT